MAPPHAALATRSAAISSRSEAASRGEPDDGEPAPLIAEVSPAEPDTPPVFSSEERERIAQLQRFVLTAARKHQVDANLVNAVIWVESRFTTRARGRHGPRGLMQLMPRTARSLAKDLRRSYQPYSADFNIDAGTLYLAHMLELFDGDMQLAIAGYAAGPATVRAAIAAGESLPERTQAYVRSVLRAKRAFDSSSELTQR